MGDIIGVSVGDLYIGAVLPGLVLVGLYVLYLAGISWWDPGLAPPIAASEITAFRADVVKRVGLALLPAFALVVGVLGSIFAGVASPTEAASVGAAGGLILTMLKGRFSTTTRSASSTCRSWCPCSSSTSASIPCGWPF